MLLLIMTFYNTWMLIPRICSKTTQLLLDAGMQIGISDFVSKRIAGVAF